MVHPSVLTREQAAAELRCSLKTVDRLRGDGTLTSIKVGRSVRIHRESLDRVLTGTPGGAPQAA